MDYRKQKAILRWPGAKWRMARWIVGMMPKDHFTYVEPFGGTAAVMLSKQPSKGEVYNDLDENLVNFFMVLRDRKDELVRALAYTPYARLEYERCWEALMKGEFENPVEWARCFCVTVFQARSSMVRSGRPTGWRLWAKKSDFGQTPGEQWADYHRRIDDLADRLLSVQMDNSPAEKVILGQDTPSTLFYLDPPYLAETRKTKTHYLHEMIDEKHLELLELIGGLKGMVMLSGYDNPLYAEHLKGWRQFQKNARADTNQKRVECLWMNPACCEAALREGLIQPPDMVESVQNEADDEEAFAAAEKVAS